LNIHLQAIGVLEKLGSVANIWVCNLTHASTPEKEKKLGSKTLIYGLKVIFETKKN
jgi:hypothetical protein